MSQVVVPDIGDFKEVEVIEVLVKPGDAVSKEQSLITLESDKATMEIPSPSAGVVKELKLKIGDKVSKGSPILVLDEKGNGETAPEEKLKPPPAKAEPPGPAGGAMTVPVPDIGDFKEIEVIEVLVKAGDAVTKEQSLITLESDKATMEIPSPAAGVVKELKVKVGDKVSKGSAILVLDSKEAPPAQAAKPQPAAKPAASAAPAPAPSPRPVPAEPRDETVSKPHASPSVRKFARELGVDLARVQGSGPKGRILHSDVQAFVKGALAKAPAPAAKGGGTLPFNLPAWPEVDFAKFGPVEREPLSRIQKLSGPYLHRNWISIPHVTQFDEADITDLEAFRKAQTVETEKKGFKLTMLAFMIKACVTALRQYPKFNSSLDKSGEGLIIKKYYHIGVAVDTPGGLVVPVVRDADRKGVFDIAHELGEISKLARDGKLKAGDMQGGTFSISSLGGIGGTAFTPIINAPEVAILGVSRGAMRPVWVGKAFEPRLVLPLSLSYDHRVIDGATAARFCSYLVSVLSDIRKLILEMPSTEVKVPDIGDFKEVEVIEVLVKPGDAIAKEQSLVTLESDKATMEIPSPAAGKVTQLKVKVGDKVSQGSTILLLESQQAAKIEAPGQAPPTPSAGADIECDVLVLGAGPGGYSAAFRAADLGMKTVLVERYPVLGGVCLNVGCIPSKALLHTAAIVDGARALASHGISFGEPKVDLARLRAFKDKVVGKLTGGLAGMAKARKVTVVQGSGSFLDKNRLQVDGKTTIRFTSAIIAAGSQAAKLPFLPEDPRIVDSTGALELKSLPKKMLVIGGGIIGLEMGTVYSTLGARLDVVEMMDGLMLGADRDLVAVWQKFNAPRFDKVMLKTKTTKVEAAKDGIKVAFDSNDSKTYDMILVSVGRVPNGKKIGADKAGVAVDERGFIKPDSQMRTNVANIYAIGDIAGNPMLAHKAVHEGHVAAEAAAGMKSHFDARVVPSVAYTDPEIAWVGLTEDEAKKNATAVGVAKFPWAASGRAIANARDEGFTKLVFDAGTHRVLGGGIVGLGAGDLIAELALAVEMGADATDIGKTIHPHPTTSESVGMAAEVFEGVCTDLPPQRKK